jgi:hypothetical protein
LGVYEKTTGSLKNGPTFDTYYWTSSILEPNDQSIWQLEQHQLFEKKRTFRVKVVKHFLKLFEKANEGRVLENNRNFNEKKMFTQSVYVSSEFSICCQKHLNAVPS